jgi:UDP-GlcNAc:undecaprenyl-phosphate/decaprenyl-phosphate GlcNAc-1-phosphate transferase
VTPPYYRWLVAVALAAFTTLLLTPLLARFSPALRLVDHPGGRKKHAGSIPLVGGIAIFVACCATAAFGAPVPTAFCAAAAILVTVGAVDDAVDLGTLVRFAAQIAASIVMILFGALELQSVGNLLGTGPIGLWIFLYPMTVFAVVGVINSINMMDGMDGLAGSVVAVALSWYALVAHMQGQPGAFAIALVLAVAVSAFLAFNLRLPWRRHARVFLGDAGSMMLGFAVAWLALDLTQFSGRTFPPISALWVVLLPLADCVSLMARRVRRGRSPFAPDSRHIHHYLQARGLGVPATHAVLVFVSTLFGAIGVGGWWLRVPEPYLFGAFFFLFFGYHFWIEAAWKRIESRPDAGAEVPAGETQALRAS